MTAADLLKAYQLLFKRFRSQHWWPGETPFEVMVGAILTQNTNWTNVEKAIANLKKRNLLTPRKIQGLPAGQLAGLIRPSGYFNIKAVRLKNFVTGFVRDFSGDITRLKKLPLPKAREWLLGISGIGPETADSILLYALGRPVFVVDAYTKRILERHYFVPEEVTYDELQDLFMDRLAADPKLFNEYHALLVRVGKDYCRKTPLCEKCPLNGWNW